MLSCFVYIVVFNNFEGGLARLELYFLRPPEESRRCKQTMAHLTIIVLLVVKAQQNMDATLRNRKCPFTVDILKLVGNDI